MTARKSRIEGIVAAAGGRIGRKAATLLGELAEQLDAFRASYSSAWLATCRPSSLKELDDAFRRSALYLRRMATSRSIPPGDPDSFQPLLRRPPSSAP